MIATAEDIPLDLKAPLSESEQALSALISPENLFWVLAILLALVLLATFGWWREAGFNRPSRWQNARLLLFPLLVGLLALSGGIRDLELAFLLPALLIALIAAFGDEMIYRGILWRVLASKGLVRAVLTTTSLLSGALYFGRALLVGPWPEALLLTIPVICAGFTFAALRWRTTSIWPVILLHFALASLGEVCTPGTVPYLVPLLFAAGTLGFVGYGLFLLRNPCVREDGG